MSMLLSAAQRACGNAMAPCPLQALNPIISGSDIVIGRYVNRHGNRHIAV
jgi:hypothetical protein